MRIYKILIPGLLILGIIMTNLFYPVDHKDDIPEFCIEIPEVLADDILTVHYIRDYVDQINEISDHINHLQRRYNPKKATMPFSKKENDNHYRNKRELERNITQLTFLIIEINNKIDMVKVDFSKEKINAIDSLYNLLNKHSKMIYKKINELEYPNHSF